MISQNESFEGWDPWCFPCARIIGDLTIQSLIGSSQYWTNRCCKRNKWIVLPITSHLENYDKHTKPSSCILYFTWLFSAVWLRKLHSLFPTNAYSNEGLLCRLLSRSAFHDRISTGCNSQCKLCVLISRTVMSNVGVRSSAGINIVLSSITEREREVEERERERERGRERERERNTALTPRKKQRKIKRTMVLSPSQSRFDKRHTWTSERWKKNRKRERKMCGRRNENELKRE